MSTRNTRSVRSRLARKLATYVGLLGATSVGTDATGAIVYTDLGPGLRIEPQLPSPSSDRVIDGTIEIDIDLDGQPDFLVRQRSEWDVDRHTSCSTVLTSSGNDYRCNYQYHYMLTGRLAYLSGFVGNRIVESAPNPWVFPNATRIPLGAPINSLDQAQDKATLAGLYTFKVDPGTGTYTYGEFASASGFAGVIFRDVNQQLHTGWLKIQEQSGQLTLFSYAYETVPGKAIAAGAVPEPPALVLLAGGAAGLAALRAKRNRSACGHTSIIMATNSRE